MRATAARMRLLLDACGLVWDMVERKMSMRSFSFPVFKTKVSRSPKFRLEDPADRRRYFDLKAKTEIAKLRDFLRKNTFVGFLLGPKNSGKGTYSKLFVEALRTDKVAHISVGDIVRSAHKDLEKRGGAKELAAFLKTRYRGFISVEKVVDIILGRDTVTLLPTEVILALVEREIDRIGRKAIFIDGFPRNLDQVSYSLYFRSLIGYRDDPDFFVFIDVPEAVIDERMKYRVVCPVCHTPRNLKLLRTKEIEYDEKSKTFHLLCDTPGCSGGRMTSKEGDELGIEAIRGRIEVDKKVMRQLLDLQGVPKIYLRNSVPVADAKTYVDEYEITPSYRYEWDSATKKVRVIEEPWVIKDESGVESYSLLPAAVVLSLIKQTARALGI